MMKVKPFNKKDFEKIQKAEGVCVLQFWSTWCRECFDTDHLNKLQNEFKNVYFFRVNFEDNEEMANKYHVKMVPSYVFVKNFKPFAVLSGLQTQESLRSFL